MKKRWFMFILSLTFFLPLSMSHAQGGDQPSAPPDDIELPLGDLVYTADFTDEAEWPALSNESLIVEPTENGFQISNTDPEQGLGLFAPNRNNYDNLYTEFAFTIDVCNDDTSAALFTVRDVDFSNNYVFVMQCNGSYRSRPIINDNVGNIDVRGSADGVTEGTDHVMGVLLIDDQVTWYLDGVELESFVARNLLDEGAITFGTQLGMQYTLTSWRVWEVSGGLGDKTNASDSDDPLLNEEFTQIIYHPEFAPPSTINYGLHYPIARYYNPNGIGMYNNDETAIMALPEVYEENYYFEINYIVRSCLDDALIGVIWRASEDLSDFYVFGVQCDGNYRSRLVIDGEASDILSEGASTPMESGTLLAVSVYVRGDTAYLYHNQELVSTIDSSALTSGTPGIILQSSSAGATVDILMTDLIVVGVSE